MNRCPRCQAVLGGGGVCGACLLEGGDEPVMLGALELEEPIGEGGMGQVYRARHARLGRTVAVKLLPAALAEKEDFRRRFEREAQALARLAHPGIVTVHDFGEEDGQYYLVMEFAPGGTVAQLMPMPPERAIAVGIELADALAYAHAHGIVHRDIKPANVLIGEDGRPKLTDFGVARFIGPHSGGWTVTQPDRIAGTPHYMAPEVIDGAAPDPRQDQYALGVLLYELVTGKLPIGDFAPLPGPLDAIVRRLLAPEPDRRFASAADVSRSLRELAPAPAADEQEIWLQGVAALLTVCTAIVLWALLLCLTPRVMAPGDALPLVMIDEATRLPDGRLVSWARFEIGPLLAAVAAVGVGAVASQLLALRWRRGDASQPAWQAQVVLKLGVLAVAMYGTRRAFEAAGYIGIFRYIPIVGGLIALGAFWFTTGAALVRGRWVSAAEFALVAYAWTTLYTALDALWTHRGSWRMSWKSHVDLLALGWIWAAQVTFAFASVLWAQPAVAAALFRVSMAFQVLMLARDGVYQNARTLAAALLMLAGAVAACTTSGGAIGAIVALASAVFAAYYQRFAKPALEGLPKGPANVLRNAHVVLVLWFAVGWPRMSAGTHALIALAALAGPYLHNHAALKRPGAGVVPLVQPLLVLAFTWLWLGLLPAKPEWIAISVILAGAAWLQSIRSS